MNRLLLILLLPLSVLGQSVNGLLLRQTIHAPYATKGSTLTWGELDNNFVILGDAIKATQTSLPGGVSPFNASTTYSNVKPDYVTYNANVWQYIKATSSSGVTPGTDPTTWKLTSSGALSHQQNTDTKLAQGTTDEIAATDIQKKILNWTSPVAYKSGQFVTQSNQLYKATIDHTSNIFSTDLSNGRWVLIGSSGASISATAPLNYSAGVLSMPAATGSQNGYLTSTNWTAFNSKIGGSGTTNQIPYFSNNNTLASGNRHRVTGGDDFPYLWLEGTHSPLMIAYSSSTDNTGAAGITASVNGSSVFNMKAFGTADNTDLFTGFPKAGNQVLESTGDLALLPSTNGTLWLGYGEAKVNDSFFHISVPTKIDNLANSTSNVVVANSTGVLSTARRPRALSVNTTLQTSDGPFLYYLMPAGTLSTNGDALVITYAGDKTSTIAGTVDLFIGATLAAKSSVSGTGLQQMPFQAVVTRTSDTEVSIACIKGDVLTSSSTITVSSLTSNSLALYVNITGGLTSRSAKINLEPAP